ncbi:hypothetical protein BD414DRAFT_492026 [Trametes punicea]|nr:hypothetical protein BD414DRAFT_492026 [Trametes punicea]
MAAQALAEDQLLELLLTLKRTTPDEARTILNSQPQIAYALMTVMANIGAVKMEVVQETLAKYGALPGAAVPTAAAAPAPAAVPPHQPPSAIPPYMQSQGPSRGGTPTYPSHGVAQAYPLPGYPGHGYGTPPPPGPVSGPGYAPPSQVAQQPPPNAPHAPPHAPPPPQARMQPPHMQGPTPAGAPPTGPRLPDAFSALPEEQKALIMRVMQMSREEIYAMPPNERESIITLRTTLGLPT